jgi:hypothetical protein
MLLEQYQRRSKLTPGSTITIETLDNARRQSGNSSRQPSAGDCLATPLL